MKPSSLGDVVHTLPSAAILRRAFPAAHIRWVINTEWMPLLQGNPDVDEVVEFPRRELGGAAGLFRTARWARAVRDRVRPDVILDYQGLLRSALISRLCRRADARLFGLSDAREGSRLFYDRVIDTSGAVHAVERYLALTRAVTGDAEKGEPLTWHLPAGEMPVGFDASEPYVVFHPFSRGAGKSLTPEQVSEFSRVLAPHRVVVVGRTSEPLPEISNAFDLLNRTTLLELIWLIRHARFTVSVDSGPMHIAAALSERLVSIHTWSDPAKVGPYRLNAWVWKDGKLFMQQDRDNSSGSREVSDVPALAEFVKTQL